MHFLKISLQRLTRNLSEFIGKLFSSVTHKIHMCFPPFSTEPDMASKMIPNNMKHRRIKPRVNATAEVRAGEGLEPP